MGMTSSGVDSEETQLAESHEYATNMWRRSQNYERPFPAAAVRAMATYCAAGECDADYLDRHPRISLLCPNKRVALSVEDESLVFLKYNAIVVNTRISESVRFAVCRLRVSENCDSAPAVA
jgi:hypothetical protein